MSGQGMIIVDRALAAEEMGVDGEWDVDGERGSEMKEADIGDE